MTEPRQSTADFKGLVAGLGATVMATLQQVEGDDETGQTAINATFDNARHLISTLTMLEEKTKGNLTDDEERFLASTIRDVRFAFVRLQEQPTKKA